MQDFGFSDLRFVNPYTAPFEAAQLEGVKSAVGAASVMASARAFVDLSSALKDVVLAVGTTALGGRELDREVFTLQMAAPEILDSLSADAGEIEENAKRRVALLFGSEKTGLTNEQLSHCQRLLTIPLFAPEGSRHLSMNLGQAVAVCLYELTREGMENARALPVMQRNQATGDERERLTTLLRELMQATGYSRRFPANARETVVRRLAHQLGGTRDEAATWLGILRQAMPKAITTDIDE